MRAYFLNNAYLSSIQNGIQSLHSTVELMLEVLTNNLTPEQTQLAIEWAKTHKTVIVLNGGSSDDLLSYIPVLEDSKMPWAKFHEPAINDALTSLCVIVPERIYDLGDKMFANILSTLTVPSEELKLYELLRSLPLAR